MNQRNTSQLSAKEIFILAVGLESVAEQEAVVNEYCRAAPDLKMQVQRLLAAAGTDPGESPLDAIVHAFGPEQTHANSESNENPQPLMDLKQTLAMTSILVGGQIDRYRLMEQLGEGGMGVVYVAEQVEPVRRKVALKVIKPGMDSKQVIARFEAERQTLALMDHMNIARVLDGGTTEQGLPYFVMELVRGLPITSYCDQANASTRDRLELFIAVCSAVHHAHQKGIIHRDIKPGNVLVTLHDGKPVVKVIDFGVAKALNQPLSPNTVYTALNQVVGTPLYMSPEQMELSGLDIDIRSDIYSMGVLLYELLTGTTPFNRERLLKSGFDEMRRIIREEDPPRPSDRITTLPKAELSTCAKKRGLDDRTFTKSIQHELDWITLKALEKDRNRRYESSSAFGADVNRYLADEPVQACPPSTWYRFSKTVRRNRGAVLASSAVAVALLLGMVTTFLQLSRAWIAEGKTAEALTKIVRQQEVSQSRLEFAEQAVDDMYTQFAKKWISQQAGLTTVQREFLEKAAKTYERLAETDDDSQRAGLRTIKALLRISHISNQLGDRDKGTRACMNSIEIAEKLRQNDPMNSQVLLWLAKGQACMAGIYRESTEVQKLIEVADSAYANLILISPEQLTTSEDKNEWRKCWGDLANLYTKTASRVDKASKAAELTVQIAKSLVEDYPKDADFRYGLANAYRTQGTQLLWFGKHNQETFEAYQACLDLHSQLAIEFPDDHRNNDVVTAINNMVVVLGRLKRLDEIPAMNRKMLAVAESLAEQFPEIVSHQENLAVALHSSGAEERRQGNTEQAELHSQRGIEILERVVAKFPDRAPCKELLLRVYMDCGNLFVVEGEIEKALPTFTKMLALARVATDRHPESDFIRRYLRIAKSKVAWNEIMLGNHMNASRALVEVEFQLGDARDYEKRATGPVATRLSLLEIEDRMVVRNLFGYCLDAGKLDTALTSTQREDVSNSNRERRDFFQAECLWIASNWSAKIVAGEDILGEAVKTVDSAGADSKNYRGPRSLNSLVEDSQVDACSLFVNTLADRVVSSNSDLVTSLGLVFMLTSAEELCENPKLAKALADRAFAQDPTDVRCQQAIAWACYREGEWQKCIEILSSETQRENNENGFVLAMAYWKNDEKAMAKELFTKTTEWLDKIADSLSKKRRDAPGSLLINDSTLDRLRNEATRVLEIETKEKPITSWTAPQSRFELIASAWGCWSCKRPPGPF